MGGDPIQEAERSRHGGRYDRTAINAHSRRTYVGPRGLRWVLSRDLDVEGRPFEAYGPVRGDHRGLLPGFVAVGLGTAASWQAAERALSTAVSSWFERMSGTDLVVTPVPDPGEAGRTRWNAVREGLGLRIEVFEVEAEAFGRGNFAGWIDGPGWYWQRMDKIELHGPFEGIDAALSDLDVNRDVPGVAPAGTPSPGR